jgi:murein L,D-transpeptidase YcbB/YkuD
MKRSHAVSVSLFLFVILNLADGREAAPASGYPGTDEIRKVLASHVDEFLTNHDLSMGSEHVSSLTVLPRLYRERNFSPIWGDWQRINDMIRAIGEAERDGLTPEDYHQTLLRRMYSALADAPTPDAELCAHFDLLLTDALVRLAYHLHFGKLDPKKLDPNWNLSRVVESDDPVEHLNKVLSGGRIDDIIEGHKLRHPYYQSLRGLLEEYRQIQETGGWPIIAAGPVLEAGVDDPRVRLLRQHLATTKDHRLLSPADTGTVFDGTLVEAVRRFQGRHHLRRSGIVDRATQDRLNIPVGKWIDQIRVDLERARWVLQRPPDRLILVNIPTFRALALDRKDTLWSGRVQVGTPARQSPVFRGMMRYLVFNPSWIVPRTILGEDILPAATRGEPILKRKNLVVLDYSGREVDPGTIQWSSYTAESFPYLLRAEPGPSNPLGRVKFMFPNEHDVYLHDTPSRRLFDPPARAFSSGCIRVDNPLRLAEILLDDSVKWSRAKIREVVDSGEETMVNLSRPVPVFILYFTVTFSADGRPQFVDDVYDRNAPVLKALNEPYRFSTHLLLTSQEQGT